MLITLLIGVIMPRPPKLRRVGFNPQHIFFGPRSIPFTDLNPVLLGVDELEALRLSDLEGLSQEAAAERMNVSRATFGRIVEQARKKVSTALVYGKGVIIGGGSVDFQAPLDGGRGRGPHGPHGHRGPHGPYGHEKRPWR